MSGGPLRVASWRDDTHCETDGCAPAKFPAQKHWYLNHWADTPGGAKRCHVDGCKCQAFTPPQLVRAPAPVVVDHTGERCPVCDSPLDAEGVCPLGDLGGARRAAAEIRAKIDAYTSQGREAPAALYIRKGAADAAVSRAASEWREGRGRHVQPPDDHPLLASELAEEDTDAPSAAPE